MSTITLRLAGPVSMTGLDGRDLTPSSMKGRGLLALLGCEQGLRVSRVKAQDKLWSDREPEQGNASLRQTLAEIRRKLGADREILISGPGWIGLDPGRVTVEIDLPPDASPETVEFAADLDVRDPEFEDWLAVQRSHYANIWSNALSEARPRPLLSTVTSDHQALILNASAPGDTGLEGFAIATLQDAAQRAGDFTPFDIFQDKAAAQDYAKPLELSAYALGPASCFVLHVSLGSVNAGRQIWTKAFDVSLKSMATDLRNISAEISLSLLYAASSINGFETDAPSLSFPDIFSFSKERLIRADQALAAGSPAPSRLAMRAYVRNTLLLERLSDDPEQTRAEATEFAARALSAAPMSATVLAVSALVAARNRQFDLASDLAERAVGADPSNPLARHSRTAALVFTGQHEKARAESLHAQDQPLAKFNPATYAMSCAITAIRTGDFDDALRHAAVAHGYAPDFRPALRVLSALRFRQGDQHGTVEALEKLKALEPDFSLSLMASAEYPVATLRDANLLEVTKSGLVSE